MNRRTLSPIPAGVLLAVLFSLTAPAATRVSAWVASNAYSGSASAYPSFWSDNFEAANDLILGRTPSSVSGNFAVWGNTNLEAINDGNLEEIPGSNADVGMFAGVGSSAGTELTFDFDQPMYVSSISYFGGWTDGGRGSVGLTVSYSTDGGASWTSLLDELNGGTLTILDSGQAPIAGNENLATTFSRKMLGGGTSAANSYPLSNYVNIYDDTYIYLGANAAITNVKFEFGAVYNGWVGVEELAVTGVPVAVPEPGAWALVLSAGVFMRFVARRRRRCA